MLKVCFSCQLEFVCTGDDGEPPCSPNRHCACPACTITETNEFPFGAPDADFEECWAGINKPYDTDLWLYQEKTEMARMYCKNHNDKVVKQKKTKKRFKLCANRFPEGASCEECKNWVPQFPCAKNEEIARHKVKKRLITVAMIEKFRESGQMFDTPQGE